MSFYLETKADFDLLEGEHSSIEGRVYSLQISSYRIQFLSDCKSYLGRFAFLA